MAMRKFTHLISLIFCCLCFVYVAQGQPVSVSNPSNCGLQILLSDNNCPENNPNIYQPDEIGIQVVGQPGTALGIDVYLKEVRIILEHTWMSDMNLSLVSPGGREVLLIANQGGSGDHIGNPVDVSCMQFATFSAGACTPISAGAPPYTDQAYLPIQSLLGFNDSITAPNGTWLLRICDDVPNDVGSLQYVELVFEPVSCLPIQQKQVLSVDSTTLVLDWSPVGDCNNFIIEYGAPGFVPGTGADGGEGQTEAVIICPPYPLMDLLPDTEYDIYIRRFCVGGGFSGNGCPIRVRTGCQPPPTTIVETFDAATPCFPNCGAVCNINGFWRNAGSDDFDWLVYQGATPTPNTGPLAGFNDAGRYVYIETSGVLCTNGKRAILESNCVRLRKFNTDTCHLSFAYHMWGVNINTLQLQVSSDGGFSWNTLWQRTGSQGNGWKKAYIGLGTYPEGAVLKFRFIATGGNGSLGDIALDQIVFHGSEDLGSGSFVYYPDGDGDGYGRSNAAVQSCNPTPPPGFVLQGGDCNDDPATGGMINPGRPEIPCNNIDDNCNGLADDNDLPAPTAQNVEICSGQPVQLCAQGAYGGILLWYASPVGYDDFIEFGTCISVAVPPNNSPAPVTHYFYVEEFAPPCLSVVRRQVAVVVYPVPDIAPNAPVEICPGQTLNLTEVPVNDLRLTGAAVTYHSGTPATVSNQLASLMIQPVQNQRIYFLATAQGGCSDEGYFDVMMRPVPSLSFSPADSFSLCKDGIQLVTATAAGGAGGYSFLWQNGNQTSNITVVAGAVPGALDAYGITVTDAAGCSVSDQVLVRTTNSIDSLQRAVTHVSSCGGADGQIFLQPLNGLPPFSYQWSSTNGVTGSANGIPGAYTITGLPQGVYRVTVTDGSNPPCPFILRQVFVNGPDAVVLPPTITPVTCRGANNGAICLNVSGGAPQYLWEGGATSACISGLSGGMYSVTITSGNCQTVLNDLLVPEPDSIKIIPQFQMPSCHNSSNGAIRLSVFGGSPGYQYAWSHGANSRDATGLAAGVYTVTVTDSRGCVAVQTYTLAAPAPLQVQIDSLQSPSCFGYNNGLIRVSGTGGTGPYHYAWPNGASSPVLFQTPSGFHRVTVTDLNGCQQLRNIFLPEPAPLALSTLGVVQPECRGSNDGLISVSGSGGTEPYTYIWSNGMFTPQISGLEPGSYSVTMTDARQCPAIVRHFELNSLSQLQLGIATTAPSCVGQTNGSISLTPSGTGPFSFVWQDDGNQSPNRAALGVGDYLVNILDGRGCSYDTSIVLTAVQVFDVQKNILPPACFNGLDGVIDVTLTQAGQQPYNFLWSNGSHDEDLIGVPAGDYALTITDALGCRYVSPLIELPNPEPLEMTVIGMGTVLCHDDSSGYIEVLIDGGTAPYSNPSLYDIPTGSYFLQATDARGCPVDTTIVLPAPPPLNVQIALTQSGDCQSLIVTRLQATVTGGIQPYRYVWSNGDTTAIIMNAAPGDYALTVTDANNCSKVITAIKVREQIQPLALVSFAATPLTCFGAQNGRLKVRISGGSSMYRYHFSNNQIITTTADSAEISGLNPGSNYRVTVTDLQTGCTKVAGPLSITSPAPLSYVRTVIIDELCAGSNNGAVMAGTFGGTPPYVYRWTDEAGNLVGTEEDLMGVGPGIYSGLATDANGCTAVLLQQPVSQMYEPLVEVDTAFAISGPLCSGTGFVRVGVEGGAPPYRFDWSNGSSGDSIGGLAPGEYYVTVTDAVDCELVLGPFHITTSPGISVGINATPPDSTGGNGAVTAIVAGGTAPFTYFWSTGDTTSSLHQLPAGGYFLTVTDAAGCIGTAGAILVHTAEPEPGAALRVYPNPGKGLVYVEYESPVGIELIRVRSLGGQLALMHRCSGQRNGTEALQLESLPAGVYVLEIIGGGAILQRRLLMRH